MQDCVRWSGEGSSQVEGPCRDPASCCSLPMLVLVTLALVGEGGAGHKGSVAPQHGEQNAYSNFDG